MISVSVSSLFTILLAMPLDVIETKRIVWSLPDVIAARDSGACPILNVDDISSIEVTLSVTLMCVDNPHPGLWSFVVNRDNGQVSERSRRTYALPVSDFMRAQGRLVDRALDNANLECIMRKSARSALGAECAKATLFPSIGEHETLFGELIVGCGRAALKIPVFISRVAGIMYHRATGLELDSAEGSSLRGLLLRVRRGATLSIQEASEIAAEAMKSPGGANDSSCGPPQALSGTFGPTGLFFAFGPGCRTPAERRGRYLVVDFETGEVTDPERRGSRVWTHELAVLQRRALDRARLAQAKLSRDATAACNQ